MARSNRSIGKLFSDPNLALTVLDALRAQGLAPYFDSASFASQKKYERDDYALDIKARKHLLSVVLSAADAAKVTQLSWEGSDDAHHDVWTYWDGEDDAFDVRLLDGIEALPNLKDITFAGGWDVLEMAPLLELRCLESISIEGGFVELSALEAIETLRSVTLRYVANADSEASRAAADRLRARGVEVVIEHGKDRQPPTVVGSRELVIASVDGDTRRVRRLLAAGAPTNSSVGNDSAFHVACFDGRKAIVAAFLKAGADPNCVDPRGFVPLELAASRNRAALVRTLVHAGAELHRRNSRQGTALHTAAAEGALSSLKALIDAGARVSDRDQFEATPLLYAAMHRRKTCVAALLKAGANAGVADANGKTAMHHALEAARKVRVAHWQSEGTLRGRPVRYEITTGNLIFHDPPDSAGSLLMARDERLIAKRHCRPHHHYLEALDIARALLRAGASPAVADADGLTPIHLIVACGDWSLFYESERKLDPGVSVIEPTSVGWSVAHAAVDGGDVRFLKLLSADVSSSMGFSTADESGMTPLHLAAKTGNRELVMWTFGRHNPAAAAVDSSQRTPAQLADKAGFTELAAELRTLGHAGAAAAAAMVRGASAAEIRAAEQRDAANALDRPKGEFMSVAELLRRMTDEGAYLEDLPNSFGRRDGREHVIVVSGDSWVDGWFERATEQLDPDAAARKLESLQSELEARARDGEVLARIRPAADLPASVRVQLDAIPAAASSTIEHLMDGQRWLKVMDGLAYRNDPVHGWHSIIFDETGITSVDATDSDRVGEEFGKGTVEPVPAAYLATLPTILAKAADLRNQYLAGEIAFVTPQYAELRYLNLVLNGEAVNARVNARVVESSRTGRVRDYTTNRMAYAAALGAAELVAPVESWLRTALGAVEPPAPPKPPAPIERAKHRLEIDTELADRVETIGSERLVSAAKALKLAYKTWTWGNTSATHHGVKIEGASLLWFTQSASPHGSGGAANQTFTSFLRDGQTRGDRPTGAIISEVVQALRSMVETAEGR